MEYKTPGVYVEEITTLPPSVAEVETAIPAFIGYTETGIPFLPKRIASLALAGVDGLFVARSMEWASTPKPR